MNISNYLFTEPTLPHRLQVGRVDEEQRLFDSSVENEHDLQRSDGSKQQSRSRL